LRFKLSRDQERGGRIFYRDQCHWREDQRGFPWYDDKKEKHIEPVICYIDAIKKATIDLTVRIHRCATIAKIQDIWLQTARESR